MYPDCNPDTAESKAINGRLEEIRKLYRKRLCETLTSVYYLKRCSITSSIMNTVHRLCSTSGLTPHLAIKEAIRMYKTSLDPILLPKQLELATHEVEPNGRGLLYR